MYNGGYFLIGGVTFELFPFYTYIQTFVPCFTTTSWVWNQYIELQQFYITLNNDFFLMLHTFVIMLIKFKYKFALFFFSNQKWTRNKPFYYEHRQSQFNNDILIKVKHCLSIFCQWWWIWVISNLAVNTNIKHELSGTSSAYLPPLSSQNGLGCLRVASQTCGPVPLEVELFTFDPKVTVSICLTQKAQRITSPQFAIWNPSPLNQMEWWE